MTSDLYEIYDRLLAAFGPQQWWPGETPFEVMVGAVLVQNTNWKNVERAIENLAEAGLLSLEKLHELEAEELAELIRPAGYYRLKAKRLKNLITFIFEQYDGSLDTMFAADIESLREGLLSVKGVGPETADSIVLYAAEKPTFVVDNYTARVWKRHGWIEFEADYYTLKDHFESSLERDTQLFNEYHALIVRVGKEFCGKQPKCDACPLADLLPESGVQEGF